MADDLILDVETRLKAVKVSVARVCRDSDVDRTSWHKWKMEGRRPRKETWDRVKLVLTPLIGEVRDFPAQPAEAA